MKAKTIPEKIIDSLDKIKTDKHISKDDLINSIYNDAGARFDYFRKRSFDVALCHAKKYLKEKKSKSFDSSKNGIIKRLS